MNSLYEKLKLIRHFCLDNNSSRQDEVTPETPPPYEPYGPPSYDEIVAVGMEGQINKKEKRGKSGRRKSRSGTTQSKSDRFQRVSFFVMKEIFFQ